MEKYQQRREKCEELFQKGERKAAFYLMRSLAKDGDEIIYCELGNLYELGGDGIEIDFKKAKERIKGTDLFNSRRSARYLYPGSFQHG